MPVPFRLAGGFGMYKGQPVSYPVLTDDFENVLNECRLKSAPMDYGSYKPFTKEGASAAFQGLLNDVTSNPASLTPGYDPVMGGTGYNPEVQQVMNAFTGQGLNFQDDTGRVSLSPGGLTVQSNKGWGATINPVSAGINVGPFALEGGWGGDKYIKGSFQFGNRNMGMPGGMNPISITGLGMNSSNAPEPLSEVQLLREKMLSDYQKNNPEWYRP